MRWIVGLDLRPRSQGAIKTARWLHEHRSEQARNRFYGVHVVPQVPRVSVRDDEMDELCERARASAQATVDRAGAAAAFDRIEAVPGVPVQALGAASSFYDVDGLIIGRHGPRDGGTVVRLGTVARQLLRQLPAATMVVPPDHDPEAHPQGPVLVATDLAPDAAAAGRFGLRLAQDLGVDLVLLHVPETGQLAAQLGAAPHSPIIHDPEAFENWVETYGLGGARTETSPGDPVEQTLKLAQAHDASVIVCGSRRLSLSDRVFQASTGSTLAAYAKRPVVVVPPESMVRVPG
ncbi:MAG: universal stress protein [Myxococcales bacterium]|nr:universal stress protein [Myxococcales bacterium]MCB9717795.1 universal stress protein [Myxococcales bacterium]